MSNLRRKAVFLVALSVVAMVALAQKTSLRLPPDNSFAQLKSDAGEDTVRKDCGFCHSTDYIVIQPRFAAQQWDAEVKKMIAVYGAPIGASDAKAIADYLARNYGAQNADSKKSEAAKP